MLVAGALVALVLLRPGGAPEAPAPPPGVDVRAYDVRLRLDPDRLALAGRARLTVRHGADLATLPLGLDGAMAVRAVRVNGRPVEAPHRGGVLAVPIARPGVPGDTLSVVEVVYGGTPRVGLYAGEAAGQRVVYTDAWPARSAGWLPALHHPSDPAALALELAVPPPWEAVASGVPAAVVDSSDGLRYHRFRLGGASAPVYTFAFAVADFATTEGAATAAGVPVRHHLLAADSAAAGRLARTAAVLDTLAALLGPYPYGAYATVQVPMRYAGMENAAAPFLQAALYAEPRDGEGFIVEEVNVHEAVHQWFGNRVPYADWADLWLAEGAATYLTTVVYERLDGAEAARRHRVRMAQLAPRDARRAVVPDALGDPMDVLTPTAYQKGGAVFHLLRLRLGDAAFFGALRRTVAEFGGRPLSTVAFHTLLEDAAGTDLDALFDVWVYGTAVPTLRTTWRDGRLAWALEGDGGTLAGLPVEVFVKQGDAPGRFVSLLDGGVALGPGPRPAVYPVGVPLTVR